MLVAGTLTDTIAQLSGAIIVALGSIGALYAAFRKFRNETGAELDEVHTSINTSVEEGQLAAQQDTKRILTIHWVTATITGIAIFVAILRTSREARGTNRWGRR